MTETDYVHILPDRPALERACAERLIALEQETLTRHDSFHIALAGGRTPRGLYRLLATPPYRGRLRWERLHVYFGDERCVPPQHADSNYRMARESLLEHVPIPAHRIHRIRGEAAPAQAAHSYAQTIAHELPQGRLDLILLGLGNDGHIASLFPGSTALSDGAPVAAVYVERLNAWRVTLTFPTLNRAHHTLLLVSGADKAAVVHQALRSPLACHPLPVQRLRPEGTLEWYLDAAAAAELDGQP